MRCFTFRRSRKRFRDSTGGKNRLPSIRNSAFLTTLPTNSVYEPLSVENQEIRLLALPISTEESPRINCHIAKTSLRSNPDYLALSYVWGDPTITEDIIVNDRIVAVTKNLAAALQQVQETFGSTVIWVDAICINQSDDLEKAHQVQAMGSIYKQATKVIAWLGPDGENSSLGLQVLSKIASVVRQMGSDHALWAEMLSELFTRDKDDGVFDQSWQALASLLDRPFWSRVWIVQELTFASDLQILCGSAMTAWKDLEAAYKIDQIMSREIFTNPGAISDLMVHHIPKIKWYVLGDIMYFRSCRFNETPPSINLLVHWTHYLRATDPRDKIYALAGLAEETIDIDYTKPVDEIYCTFARDWILAHHSPSSWELSGGSRTDPSILQFAEKDDPQSDETAISWKLPSWVPDWSRPKGSRGSNFLSSSYHASMGTGSRARVSDDSKVLWSQGVLIDYVDHTIPPLIDSETFFVQLRSVCRSYCSSGDPQYHSGTTKFQALLRVLLGDMDPITGKRIDQSTESFMSLATGFVELIAEFPCTRKDPESGVIFYQDSNSPEISCPTNIETIHKSITYAEIVFRQLNRTSYLGLTQTKRGLLGAGSSRVRAGDIICVLYGCNAPAILRREGSYYVFIGLCFLLNFMHGEALVAIQNGTLKEAEFEIH